MKKHIQPIMKTSLRLVTTVLKLVLLNISVIMAAAQARPKEYTSVVNAADYASGFQQVQAVQAAVNRGGTVLLRGTFEFGHDLGGFLVADENAVFSSWYNDFVNLDALKKGNSTVYITKDVTIVGETDPQGNLLTTIVGGAPPFWAGWDGYIMGNEFGTDPIWYPSVLEDPINAPDWDGASVGLDYTPNVYGLRWMRAYPNINVILKNLHIDQPRFGGIAIGAGKNVLIQGIKVTHVIPALYDAWYIRADYFFNSPPSYRGLGITAAGGLQAPFFNVQNFIMWGDLVSCAQPTGDLLLLDNRIETIGYGGFNVDWYGESMGIDSFFANANIIFSRNTVSDVKAFSSFGICVTDNFRGSSLIADNVVSNVHDTGIFDQTMYNPFPSLITKNKVMNCGNAGITVTGLWWCDKGSVLEGNTLTQLDTSTSGSRNGIVLMSTKGSYVAHNTCIGNGWDAMLIYDSSDNAFVGNNIDKWEGESQVSILSDYGLSNNNTLVGSLGSVYLGGCLSCSGNVITGLTPVAGQIGTVVSRVQHQANELSDLFRNFRGIYQ